MGLTVGKGSQIVTVACAVRWRVVKRFVTHTLALFEATAPLCTVNVLLSRRWPATRDVLLPR
jgi:hypothetical protein